MYNPLINSMVYKYYRIVKESGYPADEDDLRQEAVIALYKAAMTYESENGKVTFGLYAKICIRNKLTSILRKAEKSSETNIYESESFLKYDTDEKLPELELDPEELFIAQESYKDLLDQISKILTYYEKRVFDMYVDGKTYREIALLLDRSEKSVDNAIYRIKAKLRNCM
jgi:RNA polymerase sigma factor, sigma-70 family